MVAFRDVLPYRLHDRLQLLDGCDDARFDKFKLRRDVHSKFLEHVLVAVDIADRVSGLREFAYEVVFTNKRMEDLGEMLGKVLTRREEIYRSLDVSLFDVTPDS